MKRSYIYGNKRIKNNITVKNALLWEIKRFYKKEFEIGLKALELIEEKTHVRLPLDEAGFIALHIVNAQLDIEQPKIQEITKLIEEILTIVRINFKIEFNEDSVFYYRFITHLRYFAQRLFSNKTYNSDTDEELVNIIKIKYAKEFECVNKIKTFISKKYNYELSNDEYVYLTIHIAKVIEDSKL
ncbi:PRD domain-containing protein [Clostridium baratii]|uniref:PRD domain-containing protein n=1 Tax=Clostridium baratii TaxID=1561 RepID=UPI00325B2416